MEPNPAGGSLLDEIVRDGAQRMLAAALLAEVAAYIEAHRGEVDGDGRRLVVRNGSHEPREVTTAAGAVQVRRPRVNDKRVDEASGERKRFSSGDSAGATFINGKHVERPPDRDQQEGGQQAA